MTVDKLYTSLTANHIMAKLTNHRQQTRLDIIIESQSPTTVLFRTTLTRTITLYELLILTLCKGFMVRILDKSELMNLCVNVGW